MQSASGAGWQGQVEEERARCGELRDRLEVLSLDPPRVPPIIYEEYSTAMHNSRETQGIHEFGHTIDW